MQPSKFPTALECWQQFERMVLADVTMTPRERHLACAGFMGGLHANVTGDMAHSKMEDSDRRLLRDEARKLGALSLACMGDKQ